MRNQLGLFVPDVRKPALERLGEPSVVLLPVTTEERQIRGVPDQRVFERVAGVGRNAALIQQLYLHKLRQVRSKQAFSAWRDRLQPFVRKGPAEHRRKLR